ncbi:MAG: BatD family protein, partial [Woeseiaceae bacterium]
MARRRGAAVVMSGSGRVRMTLLSLFGALLPVVGLHAAVTATIDRDNVELNESFTLEVIVDADIDLEPDISALQQDFYVGQRSQLSNTTIINGQITRSRTWTYVLMAKTVGQLIIPPLVVGTEQTEPLTVIIRETRHAPPGEADVFITSEVDQSETFVQA